MFWHSSPPDSHGARVQRNVIIVSSEEDDSLQEKVETQLSVSAVLRVWLVSSSLDVSAWLMLWRHPPSPFSLWTDVICVLTSSWGVGYEAGRIHISMRAEFIWTQLGFWNSFILLYFVWLIMICSSSSLSIAAEGRGHRRLNKQLKYNVGLLVALQFMWEFC